MSKTASRDNARHDGKAFEQPHEYENVDPQQYAEVHQLVSGDSYFIDVEADSADDKRWISSDATLDLEGVR